MTKSLRDRAEETTAKVQDILGVSAKEHPKEIADAIEHAIIMALLEERNRCANIAMSVAKRHKIGIALYEKRLDTSSVERISMAGRLRQAIHTNEFHLCYQPQFAVHNGELSGMEVLCRWDKGGNLEV